MSEYANTYEWIDGQPWEPARKAAARAVVTRRMKLQLIPMTAEEWGAWSAMLDAKTR